MTTPRIILTRDILLNYVQKRYLVAKSTNVKLVDITALCQPHFFGHGGIPPGNLGKGHKTNP